MKDFEVLKQEDIARICQWADSGKTGKWIMVEINKLINEKYQKGYTHLSKDRDHICEIVSGKKWDFVDTHEALVILREIEEEKEECDHMLELNLQPFKLMTGIPKDFGFNYCPKCGKDLNDA